MIETIIKLNDTIDVKEFVSITTRCPDDVTLYSGKYIVNGKSVMGICSLDLSKPIKVEFEGNIPDVVKKDMTKFIYKEM